MTETLFIILQVIILDGILSIDNAAALAAIASKLPKHQQQNALKAGILGAYLGRGLMLLLVGFVIQYPILKVLGAMYLLYLVGTHFFNWSKWEPEFAGVTSFWRAVILIEFADLAFSLDNVAAVVALSSNIWIIILGVCISIVIMRFAATIFIKMITWEPLLEHAAFVLIFAIAIELLLKANNVDVSEGLQFAISMGIIFAFVSYGQLSRRLLPTKVKGGE
jgi:tellurite resistance protein TerC